MYGCSCTQLATRLYVLRLMLFVAFGIFQHGIPRCFVYGASVEMLNVVRLPFLCRFWFILSS